MFINRCVVQLYLTHSFVDDLWNIHIILIGFVGE